MKTQLLQDYTALKNAMVLSSHQPGWEGFTEVGPVGEKPERPSFDLGNLVSTKPQDLSELRVHVIASAEAGQTRLRMMCTKTLRADSLSSLFLPSDSQCHSILLPQLVEALEVHDKHAARIRRAVLVALEDGCKVNVHSVYEFRPHHGLQGGRLLSLDACVLR